MAASSSSSSSSSAAKYLILKTADGVEFMMEESVARVSEILKNMIETGCATGIIPLPNVTASILDLVIEYCKKHANQGALNQARHKEEIRSWDAEFVNVDQETLLELSKVANYLNIEGLLDLTCHTMADMIKEKSPEEIQKLFDIKNDLTSKKKKRKRDILWPFQ